MGIFQAIYAKKGLDNDGGKIALKNFIFSLAMGFAICYDMACSKLQVCVDPAAGFQVFWATGPEGVANVYG